MQEHIYFTFSLEVRLYICIFYFFNVLLLSTTRHKQQNHAQLYIFIVKNFKNNCQNF